MATVYSYLRFSRAEQGKGNSTERQRGMCDAWIGREGHTLDLSLGVLNDEGVSAFKGKNAKGEGDGGKGALGRFLDAVEAGRVKPGSILAVESFDRLSREGVRATQRILERILDAGIDVQTFNPETRLTRADSNDLTRMLMPLMVAQRAYEESATKSVRLKKAWQSKRAAGTPLTAAAPEWLTAERDAAGKLTGFAPIPERVAVVKRIFSMAAAGNGYHLIMRALNAEGVASFGRGKRQAKSWGASSLRILV